MRNENIRNFLCTILAVAGCYSFINAQDRINQSFPKTDISPNQVIASPLTIEINSKGLWLAHEGELGVATLLTSDDEIVATAIMKSKDGDWMVSGEAFFLAEFEFEMPDTPEGKLRFENRVITSEGNNEEEYFEVPIRFYQSPFKTWYFGEKKETEGNFQGTNYQFIKLEVADDSSFQGIEIYAPFGTDGSRSALLGNFSDNIFKGTSQMLAEGEIYTQDFSLKLRANNIELDYNLPTGETATLPELSEAAYENLVTEFEKTYLLNRLNTAERSRLEKLDMENRFGFTAEDLATMNFIELEIDLDGSYQTREFLLYPYGPMLCGTGGCNLFVVDQEGNIISETTVVKMPVYTSANRAINDAEAKPGWKDLYVWSNGDFRRLVFQNGSYTSNASMAPAMAEENLVNNPHQFIKIMDYTD